MLSDSAMSPSRRDGSFVFRDGAGTGAPDVIRLTPVTQPVYRATRDMAKDPVPGNPGPVLGGPYDPYDGTAAPLAGARLVLVHDWLTGMRGGEKCLDGPVPTAGPDAPLYTLLHARGSLPDASSAWTSRTSFLQALPGVAPLLPLPAPAHAAGRAAGRSPPCDLVVSLSHCVAKAARPPAGVPHVCYCFTPMRYAWHMREAYFGAGAAASKRRLRRPPAGRPARLGPAHGRAG